MKLVLFDLDNTLLAGDSDYEWGQFLIETGVLGRAKDGAVLGTVEGNATLTATADTRTAIAAAFIEAVQGATTQVAVQAEQLALADR